MNLFRPAILSLVRTVFNKNERYGWREKALPSEKNFVAAASADLQHGLDVLVARSGPTIG